MNASAGRPAQAVASQTRAVEVIMDRWSLDGHAASTALSDVAAELGVAVSALAEGRESLLLRGTLDMCVLSLLRNPNHAYGIVQALRAAGFDKTTYGTIYPLVSRVRQQGLVTQQLLPGDGGPAKNVLTLTEAGHTALAAWESHWLDHHDRVAALLSRSASKLTNERTANV